MSPQDFALNTVEIEPAKAWSALEAMAGRSGGRGPKVTEDEILDVLAVRYGMHEAVALLKN